MTETPCAHGYADGCDCFFCAPLIAPNTISFKHSQPTSPRQDDVASPFVNPSLAAHDGDKSAASVEQVAKAICEASGQCWSEGAYRMGFGPCMDADSLNDHWRHIARAAINAMPKPATDDVRSRVENLWRKLGLVGNGKDEQCPIIALALDEALMAERERCAKIAEAFDHWDDEWDDLTPEDASGRNVAARMIAECIRSKDPA